MFRRILSTLNKIDELRIIHAHRNLKSTSNISAGKIAIARDFAIVLQENGWELKLIGHNPNSRQLRGITQNQFVKLAAGFDGYMALTDDGRIITGPIAREFECGFEIESLHSVLDVRDILLPYIMMVT